MKNVTLILILTFVGMAQCQPTTNIISESEYNSIEINGIDLATIKNTQGSQTSFENLFGIANSVVKDDDPIYDGEIYSISFYYDGFEIGFTEGELGAFDIINNNYNITIQGTTITVGDNINLLGFIDINTNTDGSKSIIYMYCNGCNNYISIDFNQDTNKIRSIQYVEQT